MQHKKSLFSIFINYALFEVFILGVISGMPFSILYTSLLIMLREKGFDLGTSTGIALALIPYSLKFLWAPLIDGLSVPLFNKLGRRKSWMILTIILNISVLLSLNFVASFNNFQYIFVASFIYCIIVSTYDIAYDAWRIERIPLEDLALGAAVAIFGYRIGALITGAGVLLIVGVTKDWNMTMQIIAGIFVIGALFALTVPDYSSKSFKESKFNLQDNVINPFKNFLTRPCAIHILLAIIMYKAGEAMISFVTTPFYLELGFSKLQVSGVLKGFGFVATTFGTIAGGFICMRLGYIRGLMICGVIQMFSNLMFIWMHAQGAVMSALFITVSIDNFSGGMGSAALVGYLGYLCNKQYTATQYALLSSATTLINHTFVAQSGDIVQKYGWDQFFIFSVVFSLPALALLRYVGKKTGDLHR
jgi:PAT family beta-lactamase induction signal transducer AmpG